MSSESSLPPNASATAANSGATDRNTGATECPIEREEPTTCSITIKLETDDGFPIPEADFRINFLDGSSKSGTLELNGEKEIFSVPESIGYELAYLDEENIRAKAFAARIDAVIKAKDTDKLLGYLKRSANNLNEIKSMYEKYFSNSFVEDCLSACCDEAAVTYAKYLLATSYISHDNLPETTV